MNLPNGSGSLKRSFLYSPSAAMTVKRTERVSTGMLSQEQITDFSVEMKDSSESRQ
jgi:hypothetical protein